MHVDANEESIEQKIARLTKERNALAERQMQLRTAELRRLVDEFQGRLSEAGISIAEAISVLQPHAPETVARPGSPAKKQSVIRPGPYVTAPKSTPRPAMDEIHLKAQSLLGSGAVQWLQSPHALLGGSSPLEFGTTPKGKEKVLALLAAYEGA